MVYLTYSDESQISKLKDFSDIHFIDSMTIKGKKESWALKSHWSARLDPFALVVIDDKPVKAFYSEAENVVDNLINYLNEKR